MTPGQGWGRDAGSHAPALPFRTAHPGPGTGVRGGGDTVAVASAWASTSLVSPGLSPPERGRAQLPPAPAWWGHLWPLVNPDSARKATFTSAVICARCPCPMRCRLRAGGWEDALLDPCSPQHCPRRPADGELWEACPLSLWLLSWLLSLPFSGPHP